MTKAIKLTYVMLSVALIIATISVAITPNAAAQEQQPVNVSEQEQAPAEEQTSSDSAYLFVAQPGDSYSKIARKAVQIYGIENNVNLSGEQIVFAETNLTLEAGSPALNEGQNVSVSKDTVKNWVEKAQALSAEQQAAWRVYTANVDFNTNNVGE